MKNFNKITIGILATLALSNYNLVFADATTTNNSVSTTTSSVVTTTQKTVSDATITAQVKAAFLKSAMLNPLNINVTTKNGVVFLSGVVDTDTQYSEAVSSAEATPGVKDVNANQLTVKGSTTSLQDTYITAKIKGAYIKASIQGIDVSVLNTHVETNEGVVYLSGTVDNPQQMNNAIQIAQSVDGVKSVKSALTVK